MKLNLFCMPTIPSTLEERERLRPIGRDSDRYQQMISELRALAAAADQIGVHSFSTTEHHFHTEGGEANPNPLLMFADLAARTERIILAPLSVVLPAENPVRVAENVALLDQLSQGRTAVAFARGYQKRWIQILGQGLSAATSLGDAGDDANREVFDEFEEIVIRAWENDAFDFDGKHFQVPYPYDTGIQGWPAVDWTRRYGADGEIDDEGVIRKIGIVPAPYQKPRPDVWVVAGGSTKTIVNAAKKGFVPFLFHPQPEQFSEACRLYQTEAAAAGFSFRLGENVGVTRAITVADSEEAAWELSCRTTGHVWHEYFNLFGFGEAFRLASEDRETYPVPRQFGSLEEAQRRMVDLNFSIQGTAEQVKRQIADLHRCYGDGELEYLCWQFFYQGNIPLEQQLDQLHTFVDKVWEPLFGRESSAGSAKEISIGRQ